MMTKARPHFLGIPRELRHMIYLEYLKEDDGYFYNPRSGKLRTATGSIDLALLRISRQIHAESKGLALRVNIVNFNTILSDQKAYFFQDLLQELDMSRDRALNYASQSIPPEVAEQVSRKFPQSHVLLSHLVGKTSDERKWHTKVTSSYPWNFFPSYHRSLVDYILELASADPIFQQDVADLLKSRHSGTSMDIVPNFSFQPLRWEIPNDAYLQKCAKLCSYIPKEIRLQDRRLISRFSAASAAITFLKSMTTHTRLSLRQIVIHEDFRSVASPECHILGLIPYCTENQRLRVTRRVDLLQAIMPHDRDFRAVTLADAYTRPEFLRHASHLDHRRVTEKLVPWIEEAIYLKAAGMPDCSFSLVFDGSSWQSQQIFNMLREDAQWQDAIHMAYQQDYLGPLLPLWREDRLCCVRGYFTEHLKAVIDDTCCVRFETASTTMWDAKTLFEANKHHTKETWKEQHERILQQTVDMTGTKGWLNMIRDQLRPLDQLVPTDNLCQIYRTLTEPVQMLSNGME